MCIKDEMKFCGFIAVYIFKGFFDQSDSRPIGFGENH